MPRTERLPGAALPAALASIAVIIPARDEEDLLPGCLAALRGAVDHLRATHPGVAARVLVVLDSCTDRSADVARAAGVDVLPVAAGSVGAARRAGADAAMAAHAGGLTGLWLANTDADTRVPAHWLSFQADAAAAGVDATVGTVQPDDELVGPTRDAWLARHDLREGHAHVHGANLGVRASAYLAAGGFDAVAVHEDARLVDRLRAAHGVRVRATHAHQVITSSRMAGRAPGGFATYLRDLAAEAAAPAGLALPAAPVPGLSC